MINLSLPVLNKISGLFLLLVCGLAAVVQGQGQRYGNDRKLLSLKGPVFSLSIQRFEFKPGITGKLIPTGPIQAKAGFMVNNGDMQDSMIFNTTGQLTESYYFPFLHNDTTYVVKTIYKYGENHKILERIVESKRLLSKSTRKEVFEHDSLGRQVAMFEYYGNSDTASAWWIYFPQPDTLIMRANLYLQALGHSRIYQYSYDSTGRIRRVLVYDKNGSLLNESSCHPNERFYVLPNSKEELARGDYREYIYDSPGNWIKMTAYERNQPVYVIKRMIQYHRSF